MDDGEMIKEAGRVAEERHPLPKYTPATGAAYGAMTGFGILTFFFSLDHILGDMAATLVTVGTVSAVWYLDTRSKWNSHIGAEIETLKRLRERK